MSAPSAPASPGELALAVDSADPQRIALGKEAALESWLRARGSVLVGFSGGVDSAYLACVAVDVLGRDRTLAVIGRSASYPEEQWARARAVAAAFDVPVLEVDTDELHDPRYAANPSNRCYFCKSELWSVLTPIARARGIAAVLDGTNADDLGDYRPGARAASEQRVESPLAALGFTKDDVRLLSRRRGIATWQQPASPCLSSRIPYGTAVTADRLREVETAERALREAGVVGDLRVRYHGALARVELGAGELEGWLTPARMAVLRTAVRGAGFARVAVDLRGFRSGSLNVLHGVLPASSAEPSVSSSQVERAAEGAQMPDTAALERALCAADAPCIVDAHERLAVLVPGPRGLDVQGAARRAALLASLPATGFTHLALEIGDTALAAERADDDPGARSQGSITGSAAH